MMQEQLPTGTSLHIATVHDAEAIAEVHVHTWQHAYAGILPADFLAGLSIPQRAAMWKESIAGGHSQVLIAEVAGQLIGFSALQGGELLALYVSANYWSQGVGRALWLASRQHAIAHGATRVSLWVLAQNPRAIAFYETAGFEAVENSSRTSELGSVAVEELRYIHPLTD